MSYVKFARFDAFLPHFCRNSFPASSLHRFQPTSTIRSVFLAKLCVKFVNNCRVCSSHVDKKAIRFHQLQLNRRLYCVWTAVVSNRHSSLHLHHDVFRRSCRRFIAAMSPNKRLVFIVLNALRVFCWVFRFLSCGWLRWCWANASCTFIVTFVNVCRWRWQTISVADGTTSISSSERTAHRCQHQEDRLHLTSR